MASQNKKRGAQTSEFMLEELEPRILFSADLHTAALGIVPTADVVPVAVVAQQTTSVTSSFAESDLDEDTLIAARELVIIDSAVPDIDVLLADLERDTKMAPQVVVLDDIAGDADDVITQLSDILSRYQDLQAVHLISHGDTGELLLGGERIETIDLLANSALIERRRDSLSDDADILVYGCDVAQGSAMANDGLTAADNTVTTNEDADYIFTIEDFGFRDVESSSLASIQITSLESIGSLQLSGNSVILNEVITQVDINSGNLTFVSVANANGIGYDSFEFSVNDGTTDSVVSYTMTVDVTPVYDVPSQIEISNNFLIEGTDTSDGLSVAVLKTVDFDEDEQFSYSVVGGLNATVFRVGGINSDELILTDGILDHELQPTYEVTIRTSDSAGTTFDKNILISVININESPLITSNGGLANAATFAAENKNYATTVVATDEDGDSLTYRIVGGEDALAFEIDPVNGELTFITSLNFEEKNMYEIQIVASDTDGLSNTQNLIVTINDVNEAPEMSDTEFFIYTEFEGIVGQLSATDPDTGDILTYQLVTNGLLNASSLFTVSDTGVFSVNRLDTGVYQFEVKAIDSEGRENSALLTLSVAPTKLAAAIPDTDAIGTDYSLGESSELHLTNSSSTVLSMFSVGSTDVEHSRLNNALTIQVDDASSPLNETTQTPNAVFTPVSSFLENAEQLDTLLDVAGTQTLKSQIVISLLIENLTSSQAEILNSFASIFNGGNSPLSFSIELIGQLDLIRSDLEIKEAEEELKQTVTTTVGTVVTATLSVGFATWFLQSGLLVASAISTTPLWRSMDPIPILMAGG